MTKQKLYYKDKQAIGLDISLTALKVMAVDPVKMLVQGYGSLNLDPQKMQDIMDTNTDADPDYLTSQMRELVSRHIVGSIPSDHVVIGLPTNKSFSRTFELPVDQEKTIGDAVEIEVEQYIPMPLSALYVDYGIINRDKEKIQVIMSAMPKEIIDMAIGAAENAGLRPVLIEPSINAVARILERTEEGHLSTLIVDINQATTDIAVLESGSIRISGGINIGGNTFTLSIADKLGVPIETAQQMKVLNGLSPGPKQKKISAAITPSLEKITKEIQKVIRYYTERISTNAKIEQILIVGGGSSMPGIGDYFTNALIMPARVASPWQQLDFGTLEKPNKQYRPRYLTAAGLASVPYRSIYK